MPTRPIGNATIKCGLVYLNDRVPPDTPVTWDVPAGRVFVLTDLVAQDRGPGDVLVGAGQFTRFSITAPNGTDVFFHIVGNETLNLHFVTGTPVSGTFRFYNIGNSTAPFAAFHITGRLQSAD
jgi:hypothetical protein